MPLQFCPYITATAAAASNVSSLADKKFLSTSTHLDGLCSSPLLTICYWHVADMLTNSVTYTVLNMYLTYQGEGGWWQQCFRHIWGHDVWTHLPLLTALDVSYDSSSVQRESLLWATLCLVPSPDVLYSFPSVLSGAVIALLANSWFLCYQMVLPSASTSQLFPLFIHYSVCGTATVTRFLSDDLIVHSHSRSHNFVHILHEQSGLSISPKHKFLAHQVLSASFFVESQHSVIYIRFLSFPVNITGSDC